MTSEQQIDQQEKTILRLQAKLAQAETRIVKLERMHEANQRHIARLQKLTFNSQVIEVFGNG